MAVDPVDKTVNIDVQPGNSTRAVEQLSAAFKVLQARIEDVGQALTGLNAKSKDPATGAMTANQNYNKLLKERLNTLKELSAVMKAVSMGSVDATLNKATETGRRTTNSFTGAGLSAREIETEQKKLADYQKASASAEAQALSRRKVDMASITTEQQAQLAIEAQILKIVRQRNQIEQKGASEARLATAQRYDDELRQLANLQSTIKRQAAQQKREQIDNRLGQTSASRDINGQVSLFRAQLGQMNLLDASVQSTAQNTIKGFRAMAEAAGVYLPKMQATIQNVENQLNNTTRKQQSALDASRQPTASDTRIGGLKDQIGALDGTNDPRLALQKIDLQVRLAKEQLKGLDISKGQTAEYVKQSQALDRLVAEQARLRSESASSGANLTNRTSAAGAIRNDAVFGSGAADFFKFQAGLILNYTLLTQMQQAIVGVVSQVVELDASLHDLQAITGSNDAQMATLKDTILDVASNTKFLNTEVAEGAKVLAQAGLSVGEIQESLKGVALFASATGTSFKDAADLMTSSLSVFNLRASETINLANLFTAALNFSKLNSEQLGLAIQYVSNTAAQAGIPIQDLVADVASLANAGIRSGSTIGTGLRQVLIDLMNPSEKLQARIKALGLSFADVNVQTRGLNPVIKTLTEAGFGVADAFATMETRSAAAFVALQGQQSGYNDLVNSITGTNAAVEANNTQMKSLQNTAKNTVSIFGGLASRAFAPTVSVLQSMLAVFNDLAKSLEGLGPALAVVGTALAGITTGLGLMLLSRLLGLSTILAGLPALFGAVTFAFTAFTAGAATAGEALSFLVGPAGWIALGTAAIFGLVYALESIPSAAEKAAKAVDAANAAVADSKAKYDDNKKAVENLNSELQRMQLQEKTLSTDKSALNNTVARLNDGFGDLGLSIDSTADTFDKVIGKVREFRTELQNRTILTIIDLEANLKRLNDAQQLALQTSGGQFRKDIGKTVIGSSFGIGGLGAQYGVQPGQRAATSQLPGSVQQAVADAGNYKVGQDIASTQKMLDTLAQARSDIVHLTQDDGQMKTLADAFFISTDQLKKNLFELFDASKDQTQKLADNLKAQKQELDVQAAARITTMATGQFSPAKLLGDAAQSLSRQFTQLSANSPADAIGKNQYLQKNGGTLIASALKGIKMLGELGGREFSAALDQAAGGSINDILSTVSKTMIDVTTNAIEDYKKFLPDLLKSAATGMQLSGKDLENNLSSGGFQTALQQYLASLQIQLGLLAKSFAAEIGKDPSLVGFDLSSFTVTGLGDLSANQGRQLAGFLTNQVGDAMVAAANKLTDDLKTQIAGATTDEQIQQIKSNADIAVKALYDPLIAGFQRLKDDPAATAEAVQAATINLQGAIDGRNAALISVNTTATKGFETLTTKMNEAQKTIYDGIITASDGLPTQVMSKEEREKFAGILRQILDAKKKALIQSFIDAIAVLPGATEEIDVPFIGKVKVPTKDSLDMLNTANRLLDAQTDKQVNAFMHPKPANYSGGGRDKTNEKLLKPFEQYDDRKAEIDRQYDQSDRSITEGSRITGISLDAVDYMKGYSEVERAALEAIQKQQQSSELPKVITAEQTRLDSLKQLLADFNAVNEPRLQQLKSVYDDPKFDNSKRNSALSEYNGILKTQRGLEDDVTTSTNAVADAQERYNVSIGKGVGQNLTFWQQVNAAIDQFSEGNGSFVDQLANAVPETLKTLSQGFNSFFTDVIGGTKSVGEAFADLGKNIVNSLVSALTTAASNSIVSELFGGTTKGGTQGGGGLLSGILGSLGSMLGFGGGGSQGITNLPDGMSAQDFYTDPAASSGGDTGWLSSILSSIGGWFNGGGIVRAAQGYVARDSKLALVRPGEGILRNTAMDAIGSDNFKRINSMGNNLTGAARPPASPFLSQPPKFVRMGDTNFNIQTPDANSFRRSQNQIMAKAGGAIAKSRKSLS